MGSSLLAYLVSHIDPDKGFGHELPTRDIDIHGIIMRRVGQFVVTQHTTRSNYVISVI